MSGRRRLVGGYRSWLYPVLSWTDPERAHSLALKSLSIAGASSAGLRWLAPPTDERLVVECLGLRFANPLGVAAGLDKNGEAVAGLLKLGFGAIEIGTVTPQPQAGNPKPRVWRFTEERAVINALGFPSQGSAAVRNRLVGRSFPGVIGVNVGKNRSTSMEEAAADYVAVIDVLWDVADYFTVNVSSPNTPGLRDLQRRETLLSILRQVMEQNRRSARLHDKPERPVLVKIAPDLTDDALNEVLDGIVSGEASGVIVSNTTIDHSLLKRTTNQLPGGLSGPPLKALALAMLRKVHGQLDGALPIIGVGGIENADDVIERMRAGASLVQIYTSFVFGGPALPGAIVSDLLEFVEREGLRSIDEIVGTDHRAS